MDKDDFFGEVIPNYVKENLGMDVKEIAKLVREREDLADGVLDEEFFESLRRLYPMKVDSKKLKAIGLILTFAPEGVTTFPGLAVLASSAIADRFFSPLGLDDIKRELKALLKDLDHERYM